MDGALTFGEGMSDTVQAVKVHPAVGADLCGSRMLDASRGA